MSILSLFSPAAFLAMPPECRAALIARANREAAEKRVIEQRGLASYHTSIGYDTPSCYKRRCRECKTAFYSKRPDARYCSHPCGIKAAIKRRDLRRQRARQHVCAQCNNPFTARADAKFCGSRCRQRHHRANPLELVPKPVSVTEISPALR